MGALTIRNLKVFFRDRVSVVMSFFSVLVIIGLYALFLGDNLTSSFESMGLDNAGEITNSWVIAGILGVTSMTCTLGALGVMVDDRSGGTERDFMTSPLRRTAIAGSYAVSTYVTGCILTLSTFLVGELYIVASGGAPLSGAAAVQMILGILLAVASSGSIVFFLTSLLHTTSSYNMVSLIIGVAGGFLTGVYIPMGEVAEGVQTVIKVFPVSHAASYFRILMTEAPVSEGFDGAPAEALEEFRQMMGIVFEFDGTKTDLTTAVLVMILTAVVFFSLTCVVFAVKRKRM